MVRIGASASGARDHHRHDACGNLHAMTFWRRYSSSGVRSTPRSPSASFEPTASNDLTILRTEMYVWRWACCLQPGAGRDTIDALTDISRDLLLAEFSDRMYTISQPEETPGGTFMSERAVTVWDNGRGELAWRQVLSSF